MMKSLRGRLLLIIVGVFAAVLFISSVFYKLSGEKSINYKEEQVAGVTANDKENDDLEKSLDVSEESSYVASDLDNNNEPFDDIQRNGINPTLAGYIYRNSTVKNSTNNFLVLESKDKVEAITQWYKDIINEQGLTIKTFVNTNTNNNVLNKLVGSSDAGQIIVEISKPQGSITTEIRVSI